MKKAFVGFALCAAAAVCAGVPVRVDLSGREDGIRLERIVASENLRAFHPEYLKKDREQVVIANGASQTGSRYETYTLSCVPSESGTVRLTLRSTASRNDTAARVLFDDLRITGAALVNPSFEELENGVPVGWSGKGRIVADAADGKNALSVNYKEDASQFMYVKGGRKFTLTFQVRADGGAK